MKSRGGDYDGVYMYYKERYLYSWDIPQSVYTESGYSAITRPWYIGAVEANGEVFFTVPYPSYANDYMLATISRLQPDGKTVIAYDIKLGEIRKYVDKLALYRGAQTLICDSSGNIIGSTEHLYQGGNYTLSENELREQIKLAENEALNAQDNERVKAERKVECAKAQLEFGLYTHSFMSSLLSDEKKIGYRISDFSFGYAYTKGEYTCFVLAPSAVLLPNVLILFAAFSFLFIFIYIMIYKMIWRSNQLYVDVLTGLNNRSALMKYCRGHIQHHVNDRLCLIMIDLNGFKSINDRFGHAAGDHALIDAGNALKSACVKAPCALFPFRFGGDEFVLASSSCDENDIQKIKELIYQHLIFSNNARKASYILSASIGTALGKCKDEQGLEVLFRIADREMYEEKEKYREAIENK